MLPIVERLSRLPEEYALAWFWMMQGHGAAPMDLLEVMTQVTTERPVKWDPAVIRLQHDTWVAQFGKHAGETCFGCKTGRRLYWHHVIELQNGGSNHPRNRVSLCFFCHKQLHPWLTEEPTGDRMGGFESVGNFMRRIGRFAHKRKDAS